MKDYANLRWDDAYTGADRNGLAAAVVETLNKLQRTSQAQDIVVPVELAFRGYQETYEGLLLQADGFYISSWKGFFLMKRVLKRVELTPQLVEEWKVSVKDVHKAAEKIGASI